ncbi:hypothetical protein [Ochrobactrum quorumnocens]
MTAKAQITARALSAGWLCSRFDPRRQLAATGSHCVEALLARRDTDRTRR